MTNNSKHDTLAWMDHTDGICGPLCGYCLSQSLDHPCSTSQLSLLNDMPTVDYNILSRPHSSFDVLVGTGVESTGFEEDNTDWSFYDGENQSSTPYTHGVVQGLVHGYDEYESVHWSSELEAQSVAMGSIESVNPLPLHVPEVQQSLDSFDQLLSDTIPTSLQFRLTTSWLHRIVSAHIASLLRRSRRIH